MPFITVKLAPIDDTFSVYNHLVLYYDGPYNNSPAWQTLEGMPSKRGAASSDTTNRLVKATGTEISPTTPGDYILAQGANLQQQWNAIGSAADSISGQFAYNSYNLSIISTVTPALNSNSFVASVLYWAGISLPSDISGTVLNYGSAPGIQTLLGTQADDSMSTIQQFVNIYGGKGADSISGDNRNNSLFGGLDNDLISISTGSDVIHGGQSDIAYQLDGSDRYDASSMTSGITITSQKLPFSNNRQHIDPDFYVLKIASGIDRLYSIEYLRNTPLKDKFVLDPDGVLGPPQFEPLPPSGGGNIPPALFDPS